MTRLEALGILGLSKGVKDVKEIKSAYRKLAAKYHPDIAGIQGKDVFIKINKAYEYLCNNPLASAECLYTHNSIFNIIKK